MKGEPKVTGNYDKINPEIGPEKNPEIKPAKNPEPQEKPDIVPPVK
jgi:hypothetical protein